MYTTPPLSFHLLMDVLGCFRGFGYCKQCCSEPSAVCIFSNHVFPPDVCPGMGLLDHLVDDLVTLFFVSYGTSIVFFIVAVPVYIPTNSIGRFPFLHTLSSIYCWSIFFDDGLSYWCEVITSL